MNNRILAVSLEKPVKKEKTVKTEKEKKKRQITNETKWTFGEPELSSPNQLNLIQHIYNKDIKETDKKTCDIILQQLNGKINGYKSQDVDKNLLVLEKFVDMDTVIKLLVDSKNICYYCQQSVQVLYEFVREPKQWTLDRLDNDYGHNKDNVVISCLQCNLRRKTMHPERYVFTKQLVITKS